MKSCGGGGARAWLGHLPSWRRRHRTVNSDGVPPPFITGDDAVYACRLVRYLVDDLIRAVRETVAETSDEKAKKRILQVVASAGWGGITKKELTRRTQFIRKSFRDEYLDDLVEGGELTTSLSMSGAVIYRKGT